MSDLEYEEWEEAMDEYFALKELGYDPFFVFTYLSGEEYEIYKQLITLLDHAIIALGNALAKPKTLKESPAYFRYLLSSRAIGSLRTIREMYNSRYDDDCLSIIRGVYESYLRMKLLRLHPESSERFEASIAHELGAFPNKFKKNGQPNFDICIDPSTGKEININITNREIIDVSDFYLERELFHEVYPLLSGYVHPDLSGAAIESLRSKRITLDRVGDPVRAIVLILFICTLLMLETAQSNFISSIKRRDLLYVAKQVSRKLLDMVTCETILKRGSVPPSIYKFFGLRLEVDATGSA
jgi:hypothetical protein